jgi:hypothetical protein
MYPAVKEVMPLKNYILHLKFENGEIKHFDMKPYLNTGIFKELQNLNLFNTVRVSFDSIEWANEADIDPEVLYKNSQLIIR